MKRLTLNPRLNWQQKVEALGFDFHSVQGGYWNEAACYVFSTEEIDRLEQATEVLYGMCLEAANHIVRHNRFAELGIPEPYAELCRQSWQRQDPSLYGRFDLAYDGKEIKLLEFNADTPTALIEAAVVQWYWKEEVFPLADQWNWIHEALAQVFAPLAPGTMHFSSLRDSLEDYRTVEYLMDVATQNGLTPNFLYIDEVGLEQGRFTDLQDQPIQRWFKLYPWEWLIRDEYGPQLLQSQWQVFEPAWKLMLSGKGLLPILYELYPAHPFLLPASFNPNQIATPRVRKPRFSREGNNVSIEGLGFEREGPYDQEGWVYQSYMPLPQFEGRHVVLGSWVVGGAACGLGLREDPNPITGDTSFFVPHVFVDHPDSLG